MVDVFRLVDTADDQCQRRAYWYDNEDDPKQGATEKPGQGACPVVKLSHHLCECVSVCVSECVSVSV